ncbi:MAG TPA: efflux RND transporter periplasmic adaptor subunit, partial [Desulfuromonadaceae bacterium]
AVSGGYLIDSEAQLKGGGGSHENMPGMKMDEKKPAAPPTQQPSAKQPPAKKGGVMNMDDMKM